MSSKIYLILSEVEGRLLLMQPHACQWTKPIALPVPASER
jgi:hypothetical protein